jgi:farnesyl diphosphate synthase
VNLARRLADAAGARGMVGGQMLDMAIEADGDEETDIGLITRCQRMKTGALIAFQRRGRRHHRQCRARGAHRL